ncbi:thioredoxin family protein [Morganella morganii]|uniref:thioredoxin family protein n=1 Tax=Morganella morganii TaxID=582 RepID=UPI001BDA781E|nr:thioredoxin domain-containing protein [Morganella morganii]MBT0384112.1 thioredoxin [Morganella morganii subsp. morganii]
MIPDYTESNFAGIEHGDGISVIRFHAPWCEPCRRSEHQFDKAVTQFPAAVRAGKVNVMQAPVLAAKYAVWGLPVILIFKDGQEFARISGPQPASVFTQAVHNALL